MIGLQQQLEMLEYRRFRGGRLGKRRNSYFDEAAGERELNLVAMMDMLTILLVFLLKSYSVSAMSIPVGQDKLSVPISSHLINPKEAVKLTVTKITGDSPVIAVEEDAIIELTPEKVAQLRANSKKRKYMIQEVNAALLKKAQKIKDMAELNSDVKFDNKIMVIADKETPYWLITSVLFSAAEAGFDQYNLVAIREIQ